MINRGFYFLFFLRSPIVKKTILDTPFFYVFFCFEVLLQSYYNLHDDHFSPLWTNNNNNNSVRTTSDVILLICIRAPVSYFYTYDTISWKLTNRVCTQYCRVGNVVVFRFLCSFFFRQTTTYCVRAAIYVGLRKASSVYSGECIKSYVWDRNTHAYYWFAIFSWRTYKSRFYRNNQRGVLVNRFKGIRTFINI